ncbi:LacI family DNA-binding transcriptional regulator [Clavibacter zhangzhiyongii]|jgi:DNA-binding LacI/PurR family transcriptional regulator|uniref:LacI family DNA-binding transcriptional regulator n=1 Tax=Clavibacter zhangzhiyongii TaxID=2768071 RepID=UPI00195B26AA|nr:LacI family DNA-binding transcriptional regulator [Clavibacter zhangzhiyongii]MBM7025190.1 LacI family DNA-binding transcriptional regulator [Clavibacter zhangzhiyongii]
MVTIRDVAADAGVARSTVSYVLSGKKKLPDATRERVLASVSKLGYRPDPAARALALRRTNILGFLASIDPASRESDIEVFMRFVRAGMYEANLRGFDLLIMGKGEDELRGDVLADALVVMDIRDDDPRIPVLQAIGLPTVLVGHPGRPSAFSAVDLDFEEAGRVAVDHLVGLGHREIALLGSNAPAAETEMGFAVRFRRGFVERCAHHGVRGAVVPFAGGDDAVGRWLDAARDALPDASAVVAHTPGELEPIAAELRARGIRIPEDCSLITVAPEVVMRASALPLTVIDLPGDEMVRRATGLVADELAGTAEPGVVELLPAVLGDLGSTGPHVPGVSGSAFRPAPAPA